jgi:hypothetical protein
MTDSYSTTTETTSHAPRMALWTGLVVSVAANIVANAAGGWGVLIGVVTGLLALACVGGLVVDHRNRRRT